MAHAHHFRIHEPIALAVLAGAAASLHVLWIANVLIARVRPVAEALNVLPELGPVSGLSVIGLAAYVIVFIFVAFWFRGRDCMSARDRVFWFFVSSVIAFASLTLPFVSGFGKVIR